VAILYLFKVIPVITRLGGWKTLLEAGVQLNFSGHIKEYGRVARETNNHKMQVVFYSINALVVFSVVALLCGLLTVILPN
jgi:hypothetical protein